MNLEDYLERKAEYIFYNCPVNFYGGIGAQELEGNRGVIIETLKRGLRELAQIHNEEFFGDYLEERYRQNMFTGRVRVRWGEKPGINEYSLSLYFRNWAFTKIMLEKANKEFKDLFNIRVEVAPVELRGREFSKLSVSGAFVEPHSLMAEAVAFFLIHPTISKFSKNNIFSNFEGMPVKKLFWLYIGDLPRWEGETGIFGDFYLLSLDEANKQKRSENKNLILFEKPNGNDVDVIKLEYEEYKAILEVIKNIKEEKQTTDKDILLKDVLLKYSYMKIKGITP